MLKFSGTYDFTAPRQQVWAALNDPQVLQATIPGCTALDQIGQGAYRAHLALRFGLIRFSTTGDLRVEIGEPARTYSLHGQSAPTMFGQGQGTAQVTLTDLALDQGGQGTHLSYDLEAHLQGRLAKMGAGLVAGNLQSLGTRFFARFEGAMKAQSAD